MVYPNKIINSLIRFFVDVLALVILSISLVSCGGGGGDNANSTPAGPVIPPDSTAPPSSDAEDFTDILTAVRGQYSLPAAAVILMFNDEVIFNGAVGVRSIENNIEVTTNDNWHLGSITKSMTSTIAARLVEKGLVSWHETIEQTFPDLVGQGNGSFNSVTLEQLLSHHSGLQRNVNWESYRKPNTSLLELRQQLVAEALGTSPVNNGDSYSYSNLGYVVAGAMLETVSGKSWEQLLEDELLGPLNISDVGFGAPGDGTNQPNGHLEEGAGYKALAPSERFSDNPPVIGPAGTVNMSLSSLAKYAYEHMVGELGESKLLSASSFVKLHERIPGSDYALGWFVQSNSIFHDGSNNLWFAKIGISINQQVTVIAVTNAGGQKANEATDKITNQVLEAFFN